MRKANRRMKRVDQLVNPIAYVLNGLSPTASHKGAMTNLMIRNFNAVTMATQYTLRKSHIQDLFDAFNVSQALTEKGFDPEHRPEFTEALASVRSMVERGRTTKVFRFTGPELTAVKLALALHEAQLNKTRVKDVDEARALVQKRTKNKQVEVISCADLALEP